MEKWNPEGLYTLCCMHKSEIDGVKQTYKLTHMYTCMRNVRNVGNLICSPRLDQIVVRTAVAPTPSTAHCDFSQCSKITFLGSIWFNCSHYR